MFLQTKCTCLGLALALVAPVTLAQSTADLAVTGAITPASCVPDLGGDIDLGDLTLHGDLDLTAITMLPPVRRQLVVTCSEETRFALTMHDNRTAWRVPGWEANRYGLALTDKGEPVGGMVVYMDSANIHMDGASGAVTASGNNGASWGNSTTNAVGFELGRWIGFAAAPGVNSGPVALKNLQVPVHFGAHFRPTSEFTTTDEIIIDGSMTLEVVYL